MSDKRPDIIFIVTDQQRGDCLGADGHPALLTPNMDEFARQGVRFNKAYSTCPSCIAARRSMLTGQFPATHGMVGFQDGDEMFPAATLPGELSKAGYQTFMVGRSMHQYPRRKRYGYDHMVLLGDIEKRRDGYFGADGHGLTGNGWTARPWHLDESCHPTVETADEAIRFLEQWRDPSCPFFLTVSFLAPHPPLCPPAFYMDRYLRMELPVPVTGDWAEKPDGLFSVDEDRLCLEGEALHSCRAAYYGLINHVDDQISRIVRAVGVDPFTGRAALDNTVVVFTSDHGEMLGDHYLFRKTYPYEGSARIPFLIQPPESAGIQPGQVCSAPVCHEDIMPTLLDFAGVPAPDCVEGRSLVPLMRNPETEWREYLHGEHGNCYGEHQSNHYLTDGKEKYVWYTHSGKEQLFDLTADPDELHNLAASGKHTKRLEQWHSRLVQELDGRPEGFTDGKKLIAGRPHDSVMAAKTKSKGG
ncbi:MAG: sulfatase-like hydrolase/transferase [Kiritimatiellales bacterium]